MKIRHLIPILLTAALSSACASISDTPETNEYWVTRGQPWEGVRIGGKTPRTRDSICKNQNCVLIDSRLWPKSAAMREYGLENLEFESLETAAIDKNEEGHIKLPEDLGKSIYWQLRRNELLEDRRRRNGMSLHFWWQIP